ncbi:MAG: ABC transporter ATP-binding protein [Actinomycetota bacterium]|nr:ABC transporter ATP-binding protein [Actinomycetota bacterium]
MTDLAARIELRRGDFSLEVAFDVRAGETVALLGPNGAGKSTLVEALAGLVPIDAGEVRAAGVVWEQPGARVRLSSQQRSVGVMFQGLRLFPALSALDNVAYGLRAQGVSRDEAKSRAQDLLRHFDVGELAPRMPPTLSGGQAQRIALARALAVEPDLLLLDEPMSALDIENRADARRTLRSALDDFAGAKLMVTHEPLEAMSLADRLVIIEEGRIVQSGTPTEIRNRPRSQYTASLVGLNFISGVIVSQDGHMLLDTGNGNLVIAGHGLDPGTAVRATIHPRAITLATHMERPSTSARNVIDAEIAGIEIIGDRVRVILDARPPLTAEVTIEALEELDLRRTQHVWAIFKATQVDVYPP